MTMQPELIEFLNARLDEDEAIAAAAAAGPWTWSILRSRTERIKSAPAAVVDAYLVRFDPITMLEDIASKRAIMREHRPFIHGAGCQGCGLDDFHDERVANIDNCPTLRALALPYADHADYREGWKP